MTHPYLVLAHAGQLLTLAGRKAPRLGRQMRDLGVIEDGALLIRGGTIEAAGSSREILRLPEAKKAEKVDLQGKVALPAFVDCHTHPVFVSPRLNDFSLRIQGLGYREIAAAGGGILSSVRAVREASEGRLAGLLKERAKKFLECGTGTIEAKSGYGLDWPNERKMLRAVRLASRETALEMVPTFLGAHAVPGEFRGRAGDYVRLIAEKMIPELAREGLAEFADVFCDSGYFSPAQAERIFSAASRHGLSLRLHADQLSRSGGAALAARRKAASADHLDHSTPRDWEALKRSRTAAVLVPGSNFFMAAPYPPARKMIDRGLAVALATDFNPGTSPCWNMQTVISIACAQMQMTPEEAITASTLNGAYALKRGHVLGSLEPGKQADLAVMDVADYREIAYYFGANHCSLTVKRGRIAYRRGAS